MFFKNIIQNSNQFNNDSLTWCWGFNLVQNPSMDYYNYKHINNKKGRAKLLEIITEYNFIDPFRELHPNTKRYSQRCKNPVKHNRLDFFLLTENLLSSIENCQIESGYRSDHSIIVILNINFTKKSINQRENELLDHIESIEQNLSNENIQ